MQTLPALMLAAAGVGFGHAVMPDHWMPLAVVARARRYSAQRVLRLSLAAGVAHVVVSVLLGGLLVLVGLRFRNAVASHVDLVVGGILVATGVLFLVLELLGRGHSHDHDHGHAHGHDDHGHDDHSHDHHAHDDHPHDTFGDHQPHRTGRLASLLVPFGAAASPDLTILPVFLAAGALGGGAAVGSLVVFAVVTIATIVVLTVASAAGARLLTAPWIDRSANLLTAGTLLLVGGLVAFGLI